MKIIQKLQYFLILIPNVIIYIPTIFYPVNEDIGKNVSFRPPGYVFAIVWPILLLLLGISWFLMSENGLLINLIYFLLTISLAFWYFLYSINKIYGLIDIIFSFSILIYISLFNYKKNNKIAIMSNIPLLFWLIFACILNYYSI